MLTKIVGFVAVVALIVLALVLLLPSAMDQFRTWEERGLHEPIYEMSGHALDEFLERLNREIPSLEERLRVLALARLGTPYERDCLGEEREPDKDPLFRVDCADCTVLILTQTSMAHASSVEEARANMRLANYRAVGSDRPVSYENRLHFTVDRLRASPYFRDITAEVAGDALLKEASVVLNRKADGTHLLPISWEEEITVSYVAAGEVTETILNRLPPVAGAALVKEKNFEIGVITAHEGMILDGRDFIHASSTAGEVVKVPFLEYLFPEEDKPRFDGVIFYEFR